MTAWRLRLIGPAAVILAWSMISASSPVAASVVPPPLAVLAALWGQLASGALLDHVLSSLGRSALGYAS